MVAKSSDADGLPPASPEDEVEIPEALKVGLDAITSRDYDHAISIFDAICDANANEPIFFAAQALALFQNGRIHDAFNSLGKGLALNAGHPQLRAVAGMMAPWDLLRIMPVAEYARENPQDCKVHTSEFSYPGISSSTIESYELRGMSLLGSRGLIKGPHNTILLESVIDGNIDQAILPVARRNSAFEKPPLRPGLFMPLYGLWSEGFFHWMIEWLPKVLVAERAGFDGTYVIPARRPFIRDSLEMLGVHASRIEEITEDSWSPERMLVVPLGNASTLLRYKPLLHALRAAFRNAAVFDTAKCAERIYISRANPNRPRRVVNEAALIEDLAPYDFQIVDMESLPLREQVGKVIGCSFLMGPTGAGLIHASFMEERGTLVELFPPTYVNPVGLNASELLGLRYFMVPSYLNQKAYSFGTDIDAFILPIRLILSRELGKSPS